MARTRKFDTKKAQRLAMQGVAPTDIARSQGVAVSTITRYLQQTGINVEDIRRYRDERADRLTRKQAKMEMIQDIISDSWLEHPELLLSLDVRLQKEILQTANQVKTYDYNSERLERGQSTENINNMSVVAKIDAKLDELGKIRDKLSGNC